MCIVVRVASCCYWVYYQKASEGKCIHSSVSEERRYWTTMDRNLRELLLVEVRIPTKSGKTIFRLSSTFRWTILLLKEKWCRNFESHFHNFALNLQFPFNYIRCSACKEPAYACTCTNTCTYNDSSCAQLYAAWAANRPPCMH